jgi:ornithine carbamoyltransferase
MEGTNVAVAGLKDRLFGLDDKAFERLHAKSLILTSEWSKQDLDTLITLVETFEALDRRRIRTPLFPEELAYAVFFDNSTRTKSAWAGAASRLGMRPLIVDGSSTQVSHGETAEETGAMLGMNAHGLGIRHDKILGEGTPFMRDMLRGIQEYLKATNDDRQVPLVNLQCDTDHPTQCMADLVWLKEHFGGDLKGKKVAVTWAYSPSYAKPLSVPQGLITLLPRFGMDVSLAHPDGYDLSEDCLAAARKGAQDPRWRKPSRARTPSTPRAGAPERKCSRRSRRTSAATPRRSTRSKNVASITTPSSSRGSATTRRWR